MIVADTNLIAYLLIEGQRSRQAERAFGRDPEWAAPLLWRSEFRNVLAYYVRARMLSLDASIRIVDAGESLMRDREYAMESAQILHLASRSSCSAYDCEFVALAQELGVKLVTSDRTILRKFPGSAVSLDAFAA